MKKKSKYPQQVVNERKRNRLARKQAEKILSEVLYDIIERELEKEFNEDKRRKK